MQTSEQINELAAALAKAQADFPEIHKSNTARIQHKNGGGSHSYKYADLADILKAATPVLAANGLTVTQMVDSTENGNMVLRTTLAHSSGQFMQGTMPVGFNGGDPKSLGSMLTYYRRYSFTALVGICADEDDDANSAGTHQRNQPSNNTNGQNTKPPASNQQQASQPPEDDCPFDDHQSPTDSVPFKRSDGRTINIKADAAINKLWDAHEAPQLSDKAFSDLLEGNREWMQASGFKQIYENMLGKRRKQAA